MSLGITIIELKMIRIEMKLVLPDKSLIDQKCYTWSCNSSFLTVFSHACMATFGRGSLETERQLKQFVGGAQSIRLLN